MIEILIGAGIATLITGPLGVAAGAKMMETTTKRNAEKYGNKSHVHYFGPWEDIEIDDEDFRGNKLFMKVFAIKVPAQERRCLNCNEIEVVRIKSLTTKDHNVKYEYEGWIG